MVAKWILAVVAVLALGSAAEGKTWALLVAGSNTWWNYRHQADICHAYHIVRKNIPAENIITMMYDDIANSAENPNKGKIINKPGGDDVYAGVQIDYKGDDVNSTNFLNILQGNKDAMKGIGSGKVIESGPDDVVFVNFADHGGTGLLCFPSEYLYADKLEAALSSMVSKKQFKKMVMYIEACEAGSNFDNLLGENTNIFVSTASAPDESSWGWYCDGPLNTCLGDLYSVTWMEHMDTLTSGETLFHQFQRVRTAVNKSHVELYGDFSIGFNSLNEIFPGYSPSNGAQVPLTFVEGDGVPSRDIPVHITKKKLENAKTEEERRVAQSSLTQLQQKRQFADATVDNIISIVADGQDKLIQEVQGRRYQLKKESYECYRNIIQKFNDYCFNTFENHYLVGHFYKFANLCSSSWVDQKSVVYAMRSVCTKHHLSLSGIL